MKRILVMTVASAIAVFAIAYAALIMPLPFVKSWWSYDHYDHFDELHRRHRMADTIVLFRTLEGLQRSEIESRLGIPPETDKFRDWDLVYPLGAERGFLSIDSEWLVIRLDATGTASDIRIVRD